MNDGVWLEIDHGPGEFLAVGDVELPAIHIGEVLKERGVWPAQQKLDPRLRVQSSEQLNDVLAQGAGGSGDQDSL